VSGAKMKRLVQELGSFTTALPLYWNSSVFLRVDDERLDIMKGLFCFIYLLYSFVF